MRVGPDHLAVAEADREHQHRERRSDRQRELQRRPSRRARGSPSSPRGRRPPRRARRARARRARAACPCAPRRSPCCAAADRSAHGAARRPRGPSASRPRPPSPSLRARRLRRLSAARCGCARSAPRASAADRRTRGRDRRAARAPRPPAPACTPPSGGPRRPARRAMLDRAPGSCALAVTVASGPPPSHRPSQTPREARPDRRPAQGSDLRDPRQVASTSRPSGQRSPLRAGHPRPPSLPVTLASKTGHDRTSEIIGPETSPPERPASAGGSRAHQLRHAHAVEMSRKGIPLLVIQRQLGYADLAITSAYLRGIDNAEIIHSVHERPAPMIPATARVIDRPGLSLLSPVGECGRDRSLSLVLAFWSLRRRALRGGGGHAMSRRVASPSLRRTGLRQTVHTPPDRTLVRFPMGVREPRRLLAGAPPGV